MEKDENEEYTRSMSHPFQGGFVAWFFEGLAGISPDANTPGYRLIHLEPQIIDGLDWVKCRYQSPMGEIESSWNRKGSNLLWTIEVPAGTIANLRIPGRLLKIEKESKIINMKALPSDDAQGKAQQFRIAAGKYQILSTLN
jgi:alpha-L-rhamnosidase